MEKHEPLSPTTILIYLIIIIIIYTRTYSIRYILCRGIYYERDTCEHDLFAIVRRGVFIHERCNHFTPKSRFPFPPIVFLFFYVRIRVKTACIWYIYKGYFYKKKANQILYSAQIRLTTHYIFVSCLLTYIFFYFCSLNIKIKIKFCKAFHCCFF